MLLRNNMHTQVHCCCSTISVIQYAYTCRVFLLNSPLANDTCLVQGIHAQFRYSYSMRLFTHLSPHSSLFLSSHLILILLCICTYIHMICIYLGGPCLWPYYLEFLWTVLCSWCGDYGPLAYGVQVSKYIHVHPVFRNSGIRRYISSNEFLHVIWIWIRILVL